MIALSVSLLRFYRIRSIPIRFHQLILFFGVWSASWSNTVIPSFPLLDNAYFFVFTVKIFFYSLFSGSQTHLKCLFVLWTCFRHHLTVSILFERKAQRTTLSVLSKRIFFVKLKILSPWIVNRHEEDKKSSLSESSAQRSQHTSQFLSVNMVKSFKL